MRKIHSTRSGRRHAFVARLPLAAAIHLACFAPAFAVDADQNQAPATASADNAKAKKDSHELQTITVTAQKRTENAQDVPISMDVLSTDTLQQMNVADMHDYVKLLPSVAIQSLYLGFSQVYMRGVASGSNGNHSGPLPSVGIYLDEQPITTIQGALDMNIYDVERVEALAGPQGTLYGASSESGTIRIITNKPDPTAFSASASAELNAVDNGGVGYVTQGYVNLPISSSAALRLVGWSKTDAGYIDNVYGTRTYPTSGITVNNADRVKSNYNDADTRGARAALKVDLNEDWSIMPTIAGQTQHAQRHQRVRSERGGPPTHAFLSGKLRRPLGAGGTDGQGQDRQLRPDLRGRAPEPRRPLHVRTTAIIRSGTTPCPATAPISTTMPAT